MLVTYYPIFDINIYYIKLVLDLFVLILFFGIAFFIIYNIMKNNKKENNRLEHGIFLNLLTWSIFFILLGMGHVFNITISFLSLQNEINQNLIKILEKLGLIFIFSAFFIKIIFIEFIINSNKFYKGYFFTPIFICVIIILIIADIDTIKEPGLLQYLFLTLLIAGFSILPLLYLFLGIKLTGESRINAFEVCIGIFIFALSSLLQPPNLIGYIGISDILDNIIQFTYITGPIGVIISILIIFHSFRKSMK